MANPIFAYWYRLSAYPTAPERALEPAIAELGEPYRAQHLFLGLKHIADFALLRRRIIIEVDGPSHLKPEQIKKDLEHSKALQAQGWVVVRLTNDECERDAYLALNRALEVAKRLRESPPDYQLLLDQLLRDYPWLTEPAARKTRLRKPPPVKTRKPRA